MALVLVLAVGGLVLALWLVGSALGEGAEATLRRMCRGDSAQADRLIQGEMRRAGGGLSRRRAAGRAVESLRRDSR
jgi:hypothetical protein